MESLLLSKSSKNPLTMQQDREHEVLPPLPSQRNENDDNDDYDCDNDDDDDDDDDYDDSEQEDDWEAGGSIIPIEILVDHVVPFLDRSTHNACLLLCRRARFILTASWWKHGQDGHVLPPWPRKIASRDPSCRVRCLTFSDDHSLLACGCFDGKIRSWDVRSGELPLPYEGHWPDEAVLAVAYSSSSSNNSSNNSRNSSGNGNGNGRSGRSNHAPKRRLLASSSTDGTIRIWKVKTVANSTTARDCGNASSTGKRKEGILSTEEGWDRTTSDAFMYNDSNHHIDADIDIDIDTDIDTDIDSYTDIDDIDNEIDNEIVSDNNDEFEVDGVTSAQSSSSPSCLVCVSTDHAYSLHFSPDDSYLVSGHLPISNMDATLHLTETIQIWDVRTGVRLRRMVGGGVPVGFLPPQTLLRQPSERVQQDEYCEYKDQTERMPITAEHRLISSCGPSKCLKLWSWNRTRRDDIEDARHGTRTTRQFGSTNEDQDVFRPGPKTTFLDHGRCIQRWFLDRFNTVVPVPASAFAAGSNHHGTIHKAGDSNGPSTEEGCCELLVATIDGPNSFAVWNTGQPRESRTFYNTNPYEIRFSPDGRKVASVDDFNKVKVWRTSDGVLLQSFSGDARNRGRHPETSRGEGSGGGGGGGGLFPIHELAFSKDSSTVAVISRCYNEVHLFST